MARTEYYGRTGGTSSGWGGAGGISVAVDEMEAERQMKALARLLISNPATKRAVKRIFGKEVRAARSRVVKDMKANLSNDPRQAYKAVKAAVYKRIIGGNISDLAGRNVKQMAVWRKERKLDQNPHQRGGNRRKRSDRTKQLDGYVGKDRGFILRFLDAGTDERRVKYGLKGRRGKIRARHMFGISGVFQMEMAAEKIGNALEELLPEIYNKEL